MITQEYVISLFSYNEGKLYWRINKGRKIKIGKEAGCFDSYGCRVVGIDNKLYKTHRIIFLMFNGYVPEFIDHKDNDPSNNRIENLRPATYEENNRNRKIFKINSSGVKGVCWLKDRNKWRANCWFNGKRHHIGYYDNLDDAEIAIKQFREKYHKDFCNHG